MKLFALCFAIVVNTALARSNFNIITKGDKGEKTLLAQAAYKVITEVISQFKSSQTIDLMSAGSVESRNISDFKDSFFQRFLKKSSNIFRQDISNKACSFRKFRKNTIIFMIENLRNWEEIKTKISSQFFRLNGLYLIVLVNGSPAILSQIFASLWELQIYNFVAILGSNEGVNFYTFMPFSANDCNNVNPFLVTTFKDGRFEKNIGSIFANNMNNLHGCSVRVAASNSSEPFSVVKTSPNGSKFLYGTDIDFINTLAEALNFKVNYTYIGEEGYVYDNGTVTGAPAALVSNEADFSMSNWFLKPNRLGILDASNPYASDRLVFHISSGAKLTSFEKLYYPISPGGWLLVIFGSAAGTAVILLIKLRPESEQRFFFGYDVKRPHSNMLIAFIGQAQKTLPRRNFARYLLMSFLMYSFVVRTFYQGSYNRLMQSDARHRAAQSIDEIVKKDYKIFVSEGNVDLIKSFVPPERRFDY